MGTHEPLAGGKTNRAAERDAILATAPKIELRDKERWEKIVAANTSGRDLIVINFAERWARLMQVRMAKGDSLEACADEASSLALAGQDFTGSMYECAVSILWEAWIHGDQLLIWHESKTQIKDDEEELTS